MPKLPPRPTTDLSESVIQSQIRAAVGALPDVRLWRNNTADLAVVNVSSCLEHLATGNVSAAVRLLKAARRLKAGLAVGSADLIGIVAPFGRFLSIEVKTEKGRLRPEQRDWEDIVQRFGGVAGAARSVDDAMALVDEARMLPEALPRIAAFYDPELERVVLCHFLCSPADMAKHKLRAEWFQGQDSRLIFDELCEQKHPTAATVTSAIKRKTGQSLSVIVGEILAAPVTTNVASEIAALRELYMAAETHAALKLAASRIGNGEARTVALGELKATLSKLAKEGAK